MSDRVEYLLFASHDLPNGVIVGRRGSADRWKLVVEGDHVALTEHATVSDEDGRWQVIPIDQLERVGLVASERMRYPIAASSLRSVPTSGLMTRLRLLYWHRNDEEQHVYLLRQSVPKWRHPPHPGLHIVQRLGRDFKFVAGRMEVARSMVAVPAQNESVMISLLALGALGWVTEEALDATVRA